MDTTPNTTDNASGLPTSLLSLLSNTLILDQTTPYLPVSSLLALGSTSKSFKDLIHRTPRVFRYMDLRNVKSAQFEIANIDNGGEVWRNVQPDENVTEDDFYGGPLLYIFNTLQRRHILQDVQTLILDGLSVTSDLIHDIITQEQYNVRILSIRDVQNLNSRKLQQALLYAVRPSRPAGTPKLKNLYVFGHKDAAPILRSDRSVITSAKDTGTSAVGITYSQGAQIGAQWNHTSRDALAQELLRNCDKWYFPGKVLAKSPSADWDSTLVACQGIISFDAVLCRGTRHSATVSQADESAKPWYQRTTAYLNPKIATHSIGGCHSCGSAPERFSTFGSSPLDNFPLLAPPPLHASTSKAGKAPFVGSGNKILLRCMDCLRNRFCESCQKWWCEDCYEVPNHKQAGHIFLEMDVDTDTVRYHSERQEQNVKVHMGLCVEECLVAEMMSGAGSNGMWG